MLDYQQQQQRIELDFFLHYFLLGRSFEWLCNWLGRKWIFFPITGNEFFRWKTLTSTTKRPAGSLSMAISKNTRGNPIFLLAKFRRHNWIKLDWLAKWFWFTVWRRPIERACRQRVPATREAIFSHCISHVLVCTRALNLCSGASVCVLCAASVCVEWAWFYSWRCECVR